MVATFEAKREDELASKTTTSPGSVAEAESGSAAGMPLFLQAAQSVQLQTAPDLKDAAADQTERVRKLNDDYALTAKNWQLTAELLNAFSASDVQIKLTPLSRGTIAAIYQGAIDNPKVGSESQGANLTRAVYLDLNCVKCTQNRNLERCSHLPKRL